MALIANVNRDPKKTKAFRPGDFSPYEMAAHEDARASMPKVSVSALKEVFIEGRMPTL